MRNYNSEADLSGANLREVLKSLEALEHLSGANLSGTNLSKADLDESLLKMIELYAEEMGYISSEQELSEKFDNEVINSDKCNTCNHIKFDTSDEIMLNEEFSNWSDALCKNGEIHLEQYNEYCYVGEYA